MKCGGARATSQMEGDTEQFVYSGCIFRSRCNQIITYSRTYVYESGSQRKGTHVDLNRMLIAVVYMIRFSSVGICNSVLFFYYYYYRARYNQFITIFQNSLPDGDDKVVT